MLAQVHQIYIWCIPVVVLLALLGSIDFKARKIGDSELFKALSAVMGQTAFMNLWLHYVRPEDAVGQPWAAFAISLFVCAWVLTVRPASKLSSVIAAACAFGLLTSSVAGVYHSLNGFSATVDLWHWVCTFIMACFNLLILASWSCGNIGRRLDLLGDDEANQAHTRGVAR